LALGNEAKLPLELNFFPSQGKVAMSERYTSENHMGIDGFNGVFSSDYINDNQKFKLFLHQSDSASCQQFISKYLSGNELVKKIDDECFLINDKYNGLVLLCVKANLISGISNHPKPKILVPMLKQIK
jgi:hypothetical protein